MTSCPQCGTSLNASSSLFVRDVCGHKKCRLCVLSEEENCRSCSLPRSDDNGTTQSEKEYCQTGNRSSNNGSNTQIDKASGGQKSSSVTCQTLENTNIVIQYEQQHVLKVKKDKFQLPSTVDISELQLGGNVGRENCALASNNKEPLNEDKFIAPNENADNSKQCLPDQKSSVTKKNRVFIIKDHIKIIEGPPVQYHCTACDRKVKSKTSVTYHNFCGSAKPIICEICGKGFVTKHHYSYHMLEHTGERPFTCELCGMNFKQQMKLIRHQKHVHQGERDFSCNVCDKVFVSSTKLKIHNRQHTGEKPYSCTHCSKSFSDLGNFRKHMRLHAEKPTYVCEECGKIFSRNENLQIHQLRHRPERPFECSVCHLAFCTNYALKRHAVIHVDRRKFTCSLCNLSFGRKDNLKRHMNTHEPKLQLSPKQTENLTEKIDSQKECDTSSNNDQAAKEVSNKNSEKNCEENISENITETVEESAKENKESDSNGVEDKNVIGENEKNKSDKILKKRNTEKNKSSKCKGKAPKLQNPFCRSIIQMCPQKNKSNVVAPSSVNISSKAVRKQKKNAPASGVHEIAEGGYIQVPQYPSTNRTETSRAVPVINRSSKVPLFKEGRNCVSTIVSPRNICKNSEDISQPMLRMLLRDTPCSVQPTGPTNTIATSAVTNDDLYYAYECLVKEMEYSAPQSANKEYPKRTSDNLENNQNYGFDTFYGDPISTKECEVRRIDGILDNGNSFRSRYVGEKRMDNNGGKIMSVLTSSFDHNNSTLIRGKQFPEETGLHSKGGKMLPLDNSYSNAEAIGHKNITLDKIPDKGGKIMRTLGSFPGEGLSVIEENRYTQRSHINSKNSAGAIVNYLNTFSEEEDDRDGLRKEFPSNNLYHSTGTNIKTSADNPFVDNSLISENRSFIADVPHKTQNISSDLNSYSEGTSTIIGGESFQSELNTKEQEVIDAMTNSFPSLASSIIGDSGLIVASELYAKGGKSVNNSFINDGSSVIENSRFSSEFRLNDKGGYMPAASETYANSASSVIDYGCYTGKRISDINNTFDAPNNESYLRDPYELHRHNESHLVYNTNDLNLSDIVPTPSGKLYSCVENVPDSGNMYCNNYSIGKRIDILDALEGVQDYSGKNISNQQSNYTPEIEYPYEKDTVDMTRAEDLTIHSVQPAVIVSNGKMTNNTGKF